MNRSWLSIVIAAIFEVMWVIGLKHASNPLEWLGTLIAIFISFYLMIKAGEKFPLEQFTLFLLVLEQLELF